MDLVCFSCLGEPLFKEEASNKLFCNEECQKHYHAAIGESIFDQQDNITRDVFVLILRNYKDDFLHLTYALNTTDDDEKLALMLKWIFEYNIGVPNIQENVLKYACMNGFLRVLRIIFQNHSNYITQSIKNMCLKWTFQGTQNTDTFRFLIQNGANPFSSMERFSFLLEQGIINTNLVKEKNLLVLSVTNLKPGAITMLLDDERIGIDKTMIHLVIAKISNLPLGYASYLSLIVNHPRVNAVMEDGNNPLVDVRVATRLKRYDILEILLSKPWYNKKAIREIMKDALRENQKTAVALFRKYIEKQEIN
jgi:hypothetical protein